jgi:hypothetical protein
MREVVLKTGELAFVDDEDFEKVSPYVWYLHSEGYAVANEGRKSLLMHILVTGRKFMDHKDGVRLNNQKYNLRPVNHSQNAQNQKKLKAGKTSRFKGVCRFRDKWQVKICLTENGIKRLKHVGVFTDEVEAAKAYDAAAKILFGEYASLNFG